MMVSEENPFRYGSGLSKIFAFMKDGERHSLASIASVKYGCRDYHLLGGDCRRTASSLRTIRATLGLWVTFDYATSTYRMSDCAI